MRKKLWFLFPAILILSAGILSSCANNNSANMSGSASTETPSGRIGTSIGDTAPDFKLAKMDGTLVSAADLRGQPAVIVFWTAWCPVCREEAPLINILADAYEPKGVRVLGINIMDSVARTEGGIKDFGIEYDVARDAGADVARSYKVTGTPTVVFLDRKGVIRYFANEIPKDYTQRLDKLLADNI